MRSIGLVVVLLGVVLFSLSARAQGSPWDPAQIRMEARELAPGVYGVFANDVDEKDHTATNAGFIVGRKGVLVVESLINGRLASQLLGEIRKHTSLPIRYLVNTSYHGDHWYGNFIFPTETTVIGHELTKAYIDTKFEADRTFMLGLIGPGRGIEEVVPRSADLTLTDRITLDLGERKVEILHIGFAQTEGDVIVWLPEEKIVFVGNMIQAPPPALPWLLEGRYQEAIVTLRRLHQMLDDQAVIIPGHGRPMRRADILFSVQYLTKLGKEVEAAVARGLTLEQAQEAIQMQEYSGYSLYPFAHGQINVPAVYKEITSGKP